MRAVRIHEYGPPDVLQVEDVPAPRPGPDQVLISVEAIGVGFAQTQMRRDIFAAPMWQPSFPIVLGGDLIGVVAEVGARVTGIAVGDRVGAYTLHGAYAEQAVVNADTLLPVPSGLDAAQATVLPSSGPIAAGTIGTAPLAQGESVLVHAASGGIGHISVQLARLAGAGLVIATAGGPEKAAFVEGLGADVVVDYTSADWADQVRAATDGRGVDVILDSVGGETLRRGIGLLAPFGRLVFYGSAQGGREIPLISPMELIGLRKVTGFALSAWRNARPAQYLADHEALVENLRSGGVRHHIHTILPLADVAEAHKIIESRAHRGRIVLTV
ncbi:quinone oxidoreductase family protein [Micromonospora endophytica]|uniref:Oxidoreductase n=1 Tax=Micromonospora endophytica TaxID=515350 RepID=A0A2W2CNX7_9ACTN|nr:zinc-binding dehydrogenase [Micromonospora endophytica]PZG01206.1 oxidoreductase [Micromonospora endophytica]RIW45853.1 oxidoreductase [Micromonospora endophytica]BCJ61877.1 oxidoreductase [Micromonospora endophytica]